MNIVKLNVAANDNLIVKQKGGGGSVTINNQEKSLEITENGVTEVTADAGFTGLSKVIVNTNVASSGGGGGSDMPIIGDGKTYLYITIAAEGRMDVPLCFSQTVANGVTIDWGDGSAPETLSGTGNKNTTHKYAAIGDYVISLDPVDGCTLGLGRNSSSYCVMGSTANAGKVYCAMLQAVEIGKFVQKIGSGAFSNCYSLKSIYIPNGITSIDNNAFAECYSLNSISIPDSVTQIGQASFSNCYSLKSIYIPDGVTQIPSNAFKNCSTLEKVVLPRSVSNLYTYAFNTCKNLESIYIPDGVTQIGQGVFEACTSLANVIFSENIANLSIGKSAFADCHSLASIVFPKGLVSIESYAFQAEYGIKLYDFSECESIPTLVNSDAFYGAPSDYQIVVPDALYDTWKVATNWSAKASQIIKKSDWDASQS